MNVSRKTEFTVVLTYSDLIRALKVLHPEEFLLNQLPTNPTAMRSEALSTGIRLIGTVVTSAAELDLNRQQRLNEYDPA